MTTYQDLPGISLPGSDCRSPEDYATVNKLLGALGERDTARAGLLRYVRPVIRRELPRLLYADDNPPALGWPIGFYCIIWLPF